MNYDHIEDELEYKTVIEEVNQKCKQILQEQNITEDILGYTNEFDNIKKKVLKEKYNIEWKTRRELNPGITID